MLSRASSQILNLRNFSKAGLKIVKMTNKEGTLAETSSSVQKRPASTHESVTSDIVEKKPRTEELIQVDTNGDSKLSVENGGEGNSKPGDGEAKKKYTPKRLKHEWTPREKDADSAEERRPKRKVALLMGYCGTGYNGMQINPGVPTIELELHKALAAAGAVSKDNAMDPAKIQFMRCARTDKGVHAAGQVCSLKMIIEEPDIVERINKELPEQIRIWGYVRTVGSFHAKNACDARMYEYLLPTYVLQSVDPARYPKSAVGQAAGMQEVPLSFDYIDTPEPTKEELDARRSYRIPSEQLALLREILNQYVGTNNFHNFTINKRFEERSAQRYIIKFGCEDPIIRGGIEWVRCQVTGQSFMLHQIRKMIGLAVMMVRTGTPASLIKETFKKQKINVPKAPALGLLLDQTLFRMYNKKQDGALDPVVFDPYKDKIEAFKEKWIYSRLVDEEIKTGQFDEWTRVIDCRSADYMWFLRGDASYHPDERPPYLQTGKPSGSIIPPKVAELLGEEEGDNVGDGEE
ncbi:pseudouridine synthase [Phlyctochytrium arcticum]|nr:pseudouridine synthase [Phlyctochytrium arcticum]